MVDRDTVVKAFVVTFIFFYGFHSPTNKSSLRESGKVKTGAADKSSAGAARADTKGRGTPDHHGELFKVGWIRNVCQLTVAMS